MKKLVTVALVGVLALLPFKASQAETNDPPPVENILAPTCAVVCVVIVVGGITLYCYYKICKLMPPPRTNPPLESAELSAIVLPALHPPEDISGTNFTAQVQGGSLSGHWQDEVSATVDDNWNCVLRVRGVPFATNSSPHVVNTNGEVRAYYNFASQPLPATTNQFFRILYR